MKSRQPKDNYKIFNTKTGRYLARNKKSTWATKTGAYQAAKSNYDRHDHAFIEIHVFPISEAVKIPLTVVDAQMIEAKEQAAKSRDLLIEKRKIAELQNKIKTLQLELDKLTTAGR